MNEIDILKIRKDLNLSQQDFADVLGVDRRTIINYEQGRSIPESKKKMLQMILDNKININSSVDKAEEEQKQKETQILIQQLESENKKLMAQNEKLTEALVEKKIVIDYYKNENEKLRKQL